MHSKEQINIGCKSKGCWNKFNTRFPFVQACRKLKFCTGQSNPIRLANVRSCLTGKDLFYLKMMEMPFPPLSSSSVLASLAPHCLSQAQRIIPGSIHCSSTYHGLSCVISVLLVKKKKKVSWILSFLVIIATSWKHISFRFFFSRKDVVRLQTFQDMAPTEVYYPEKAMPENQFLDGKLTQLWFFICFLHGKTESLIGRNYFPFPQSFWKYIMIFMAAKLFWLFFINTNIFNWRG